MTALAFLCAQLAACYTLGDVQDARSGLDIPPLPSGTNRQIVYDPKFMAFRIQPKGGRHARPLPPGPVLRDSSGKIIRNRDIIERHASKGDPPAGDGGASRTAVKYSSVTTYVIGNIAFLIFFFPLEVTFFIVNNVLAIPVTPAAIKLETRYERESEDAYFAGHRKFDRNRPESALADWDTAEAIMPKLKWYSDVEYWRGRALESLDRDLEALSAYQAFLDYSDRRIPAYFENKLTDDTEWWELYYDTHRRITEIVEKRRPERTAARPISVSGAGAAVQSK